MRNEFRKYWLVGFTYDISQFDRFIKESIWECYFFNNSKQNLTQLQLAQKVKSGDILILKSTSVKGKKHNQPFLRVKAVAVVENDVKTEIVDDRTKCYCNVKYFGIKDIDFDDAILASFRKTIHHINNDSKAQPIIDYANSILDMDINKSNNMDYQEYINLLKSTRNLILTGAPGTGKTYLAKKIAEQIIFGQTKEILSDDEKKQFEEQCGFIQFHPSYDYTDFVEGLRPINDENGNVGFERKDGIFKEFCAKALENLQDSQKSVKTLQQEISIRDLILDFLQDAIDNDTKFKTQGTKNEFHIIDIKAKSIVIEIPQNEKARIISLQKSDLITLLENNVHITGSKEIQTYFNRKYRTQQDSYTYVLYEELRKIKSEYKGIPVSLIPKKNFVFIIDEINRGEISKIFGELFFSIDPGYRGEKGRVQTQYQNIVEDGDVFKKGFFVPENVYIIGTMNDIDRSVESMDFAFRRRFAFKEIKANENIAMLDQLGDLKDEAVTRMTNLNATIEKVEGLSSAYHIGASYFLKIKDYGNDFSKLWEYHLEGLLREYLRGMQNVEDTITKLKSAFDDDSQGQQQNAD